MEIDYLLNVILVGDQQTGKTQIFNRINGKQFSEHFDSTVGVDFSIKRVQSKSLIIKIHCWDTGGQERYRPVIQSYFRGAHIFFLVFDISKKDSFNALTYYLEQINRIAYNQQTVLVGNKVDLSSSSEMCVQKSEIYEFAKQNKLKYIQVSAKSNQNIDLMMQVATDLYVELNLMELEKLKLGKKHKQNKVEVVY